MPQPKPKYLPSTNCPENVCHLLKQGLLSQCRWFSTAYHTMEEKENVKNEGKKHLHLILNFYFEQFAASCPWLCYDAIITTCWLKKKRCTKVVSQTTNATCWPIWTELLDFSYQFQPILKIWFSLLEIGLHFFPKHKHIRKNRLMVSHSKARQVMSPSLDSEATN